MWTKCGRPVGVGRKGPSRQNEQVQESFQELLSRGTGLMPRRRWSRRWESQTPLRKQTERPGCDEKMRGHGQRGQTGGQKQSASPAIITQSATLLTQSQGGRYTPRHTPAIRPQNTSHQEGLLEEVAQGRGDKLGEEVAREVRRPECRLVDRTSGHPALVRSGSPAS